MASQMSMSKLNNLHDTVAETELENEKSLELHLDRII